MSLIFAESLQSCSLRLHNASRSPSNVLQYQVDGDLHLYLLGKCFPTSEQPEPVNLSFTCTVVQLAKASPP